MIPTEQLAYLLADRAVVVEIEDCPRQRMPEFTGPWHYDVRHMLAEEEGCPDTREMNRKALAYAAARGLIVPHPHHRHLVRITRMPKVLP